MYNKAESEILDKLNAFELFYATRRIDLIIKDLSEENVPVGYKAMDCSGALVLCDDARRINDSILINPDLSQEIKKEYSEYMLKISNNEIILRERENEYYKKCIKIIGKLTKSANSLKTPVIRELKKFISKYITYISYVIFRGLFVISIPIYARKSKNLLISIDKNKYHLKIESLHHLANIRRYVLHRKRILSKLKEIQENKDEKR